MVQCGRTLFAGSGLPDPWRPVSWKYLAGVFILAHSLLFLFWCVWPGLEASSTQVTSPVETAVSKGVPGIFARVAPAVVGLNCRRSGSESFFGTGTIIDPTGLVITSVTVVPDRARDIRVHLQGGRVLKGRVVSTDNQKELSLVRIEAEGGGERFPWIELGDSARVQLGDMALTFGNSFRSIDVDDQVSLAQGVVSGLYDLKPTLSESRYTGAAIETSAALNAGTDGGPLVDGAGKLIGVLCLNYSRSRWLGTAVPIHELKPLIFPHLSWLDDGQEGLPVYIGLKVEDVAPEGARVAAVEPDGPAALAGIVPGDTVVGLGGEPVDGLKALRKLLEGRKRGEKLALRVARAGETRDVTILSWGRF
jgi:S1-C subfamily serine protease